MNAALQTAATFPDGLRLNSAKHQEVTANNVWLGSDRSINTNPGTSCRNTGKIKA